MFLYLFRLPQTIKTCDTYIRLDHPPRSLPNWFHGRLQPTWRSLPRKPAGPTLLRQLARARTPRRLKERARLGAIGRFSRLSQGGRRRASLLMEVGRSGARAPRYPAAAPAPSRNGRPGKSSRRLPPPLPPIGALSTVEPREQLDESLPENRRKDWGLITGGFLID